MTRLADAVAALVGLGAPYTNALRERFRTPDGRTPELWPFPTVSKTRDERRHAAAVQALKDLLEVQE